MTKKEQTPKENEDFFESIGVELISYEEYQRNPQKYGRFSGTLSKKENRKARKLFKRFTSKSKK